MKKKKRKRRGLCLSHSHIFELPDWGLINMETWTPYEMVVNAIFTAMYELYIF